MAIQSINFTPEPEKGVSYSAITDSSADWTSISNDTYFYDKATSLPYYKNAGGTVVSLFGEDIYTADGTIGAGRELTLTDSVGFKEGLFEIQGGASTAGTDALLVTNSSDAEILKAENDGTVTVNDLMKIGDISAQSAMAHKDNFNTSDYALLQTALGMTIVNAKAGAGLFLQEDSGSSVQILTNTVDFNTPKVRIANGTNSVFNIEPMAGTAATALTPAEGDIIIVSSTDGVFTSTGLWYYCSATWNKA